MPPKKRPNRKNNNPPTDPMPPSPQFNPAMFQAAITAAVATTMLQINSGGSSGSGSYAHPLNLDGSQGHQKECSYKDFVNAKPKSFDGN
mgnify:CR=1 FL=1